MSAISPLSDSELTKFRAWLTERGAELLVPTNPYEAIRFRAGGDTCIIYRNDRGRPWECTGVTDMAVHAFRHGEGWRARPHRNRKGMGKKVLALLERDGNLCFYCGKQILDGFTIEHIMPHAHGGPNHMSNLALAHKKCNQMGGALHAVAKVRLRDKMMAARTESELAAAS